jgi:AraC-like DNA-binding protein
VGDLDNAGQAALTLGRGWAFYVGPVEAGQVHRHHAQQIAWSAGGALKVAGPWGSLEAHGHVLAADVPHCLSAPRGARMVFLDPTMSPSVKGDVARAGVVSLTSLQVDVLEEEVVRWHEGAVSDGVPVAARHAWDDRRWRQTAEWVERSLDGPVRCQDAALAADLSESHFMHWFSERSGLAFRAYVRWLRLQRAVRALSDGSNLTAAAHEAGFSDSAHLSRTVVATFGIRPASLRAIRIRCTDRTAPPVALGGLALGSLAAARTQQSEPTRQERVRT